MITYFISHCHKRDKANAIATLGEVIRRLGYNIPVNPAGSAPVRLVFQNWEAQVLHTSTFLRATINVYTDALPIASEDDFPHLDVTVSDEKRF